MKGSAEELQHSFSLSEEDNSSVYDQLSSGSDVGNQYDIVKVRIGGKGEDGAKPKIEFRRRETIKDTRSYTDKWVDTFFERYYEKMAQKRTEDWDELDEEQQKKATRQLKLNVQDLDQLAHNLIHKLLVMSEIDP